MKIKIHNCIRLVFLNKFDGLIFKSLFEKEERRKRREGRGEKEEERRKFLEEKEEKYEYLNNKYKNTSLHSFSIFWINSIDWSLKVSLNWTAFHWLYSFEFEFEYEENFSSLSFEFICFAFLLSSILLLFFIASFDVSPSSSKFICNKASMQKSRLLSYKFNNSSIVATFACGNIDFNWKMWDCFELCISMSVVDYCWFWLFFWWWKNCSIRRI